MREKQANNLQPIPTGKQARPPVVAIVGHVDHGKTTLLDYIRINLAKAAPKGGEPRPVAGREAGGITQSIGAYEIIHYPQAADNESQTNADFTRTHADSQRKSALPEGKRVTFIDTPGHEAFTMMRARGAAAADLAVLVVAADDGVMPQTKEAIGILKKTETPFIVAITKIDSPNANVEKTKNDLLANEVLLEGYGGNVSWYGVSGITGEGISELLDLIVLASEVAGLTFDPKNKAKGFVIESKKDSRRGIVAHLVLKDGTLKAGEIISTPTASGKIKILEDFIGRRAEELLPSAPAVVVGFEKIPQAGEEFTTGEVIRTEVGIAAPSQAKAETDKEGAPRQRAILKADTSGSLEAIEALLRNLVEVGETGIGEISDGDVNLAKSTGSIIVGFRVDPAKSAIRLADSQQVRIITSDIVYKLVDIVSQLIKTKEEDKIRGALEVLAIFSVTASKKTVGGKILEGVMKTSNQVEIERGMEVVGKGRITSLKKGKESVREVPQGEECGLAVETGTSIEVGDTLRVV